MKISELINILNEYKEKYGDIKVTGYSSTDIRYCNISNHNLYYNTGTHNLRIVIV